jgi:hypothetical protein
MGSRGDLRNNAPKRLVCLSLADNGLRQDAPVGRDQRCGAVVA